MDDSHRREPRQRSPKGGRIIFNSGSSTMDCTVRDVSAQGAKLRFGSTLGVPDHFQLVLGLGERPRPCQVASRMWSEVGVIFES